MWREEIKIPEGYEAIEAGEIIPEGSLWFGEHLGWCVASGATIGKPYDPSVPEVGKYAHALHVKPIKTEDTPAPKDPSTKYHRAIYGAWNDPEVHEDAQGRKYLNVDVYSVLAAFAPDHPTGHAVKKLLCAGNRDKGSKIQDLKEAIVAIEAAIYAAEVTA